MQKTTAIAHQAAPRGERMSSSQISITRQRRQHAEIANSINFLSQGMTVTVSISRNFHANSEIALLPAQLQLRQPFDLRI